MSANEPPDMILRARARLVVVEASAGTGKTYFLERKFIDLIVHDGARVDQIVVVTFTEKATAELRGRIRALLAHELAHAAPASPLGQRLRDAYRDFDMAQVHTIHGFCQRLLRTHQPGFGGGASTNLDVRQLVAEAFPVVLRRALRDHEALAAWVSAHGVERLRKIVERACVAVLEDRQQARGDDAAASGLEALVAALLPPMLAELAEVKERGQWFDFQDLLTGAARLVTAEDGEVARAVCEATPWALIDEFQDTDALQWRIFQAIWLGEAGKGLTVVGDPKQAIYGFRGANLAVYRQACEAMLAAGGVALPLLDNYRSSPAVVQAYNEIFSNQFFAQLAYPKLAAKADAAMALTSGGVTLAPMVQWLAEDKAAPRKAQVLAALVAETLWLCGKDEGAGDGMASRAPSVGRGPAPRVRGAGGERALCYGDLMVLAPNNHVLKLVAAAMRAAKIPVSIRGKESVYETPEASALAAVLAAIAAPRDASATMRAMQTPFFPPHDAYLFEARDPCVQWLATWHALARRHQYAEMFCDLLATSRVLERLAIGVAGPRAVANVRQLIEACLEAAAAEQLTIDELAGELARRCAQATGAERQSPGPDALRMDLDGDAVTLLTCHAAKGLEAQVVFVLSFQSKEKPQQGVVTFERDEALWFTLAGKGEGDAEGLALAKEATKRESERLAYVALTRAKVRNYVLGPMRLTGGGLVNDYFYQPIWRGLEAAKLDAALCETVALPTLRRDRAAVDAQLDADEHAGEHASEHSGEHADEDAGEDQVALVGEPPRLSLAQLAALPPPPSGAALRVRALPPWHRPQRGARVVSYSSLKLPAEVPFAAGGGSDAAQLPPGRETGLCLHRLLERAPLPLAADGELVAWEAWARSSGVQRAMAEAAEEFGMAPAFHDEALRLAYAALSKPLPLAPGPSGTLLARAAKLARELSFMATLGADVLVGVLDVLCEVDGRLWVIDYKSDIVAQTRDGGVAGAQAAAAAHVQAHYQWQQQIYTLAALRVARIDNESTFAARFGGVGFLMLRSGEFVATHPTWQEVRHWQATLAHHLEGLP